MCAQASPHLLDDWLLHVLLPSFGLDCHSEAHNIGHYQRTPDVNTAIPTQRRNLDFLESHRFKQIAH